MTCIRIPNGFACTSSTWARLKVGNKYIMMDFHAYCGPTFYTDRDMTKMYVPEDENDPIWPVFQKWFDKHRAVKERK